VKSSVREQTRRIALCSMLLALMLLLGYVESQLPVAPGIPGIKLGLSNGVLIFALYMLGTRTSYLLMVLKVILSGLMFAGVNAMMYAAAGGMLSMTVMALLRRVKGVSPVVVSMAGGVFHNVGQVALAMIILSTSMLFYYMAILMAGGLITGALTGVASVGVMRHLKAMKK